MALPNPSMDFTPFDILTAAELDDLVENDQALAAGTGLNDNAVANTKLAAYATWPTWTPTWTVLTIGNATQDCRWRQTGKQITARINVTLGSTSSMGTGAPTFTLPATAVSMVVGTEMGGIRLLVNSVGYRSSAQWASTTTGILRNFLTNGTYLTEDIFTSGGPNTWGTGSVIAGTITYEAA